MTPPAGLTSVPTSTLERIRAALRTGRLTPPLTRADLAALGLTEQLDVLAAVLAGHPPAACTALLDAVLAERADAARPAPELVWTGPDGDRATARDTAVVLQSLFEHARHRVVLAGYSFQHADALLQPLAHVMAARGVQAHLFVEIAQVKTPVADPARYAQDRLQDFIDHHWPFGPPHPALFCDRRALHPAPPWCSLHAKCVAVDGTRALVSSANFTARGQARNIEAGVLLHDPAFARRLERQWFSLIASGLVVQWRPPA